jgi:hypothetical protein
MRHCLLSASLVALTCALSAPTANANECDAALVPLYESARSDQRYIHSWLQLITESNYLLAKKSASASGLLASGGMFEGDYSSFTEKRRQYLSQNQGLVATQDSRETFKTYLLPEQLGAWAECKGRLSEVAAFYRNVDEKSATIVVQWKAPDAVGRLTNVSFDLTGAKVTQQMRQTRTLNGTKSFIVKRDANEPIRGTITAIGGANRKDVSADIYIPSFVKASIEDKISPAPEHLVVPIDGRIRKSIATWSRGRHQAEWACFEAPEGFDMVVVAEKSVNIGKRRGACVGREAAFCDSTTEYCVEVIVTKGCFVNKAWHDWYKVNARRIGIPITNEAACTKKS